MQGYFSRIAKQSGLRILAQESKNPAFTGWGASRTDVPLEQEISVTVPSPAPASGAGSSYEAPAPTHAPMEKARVGTEPAPSGKAPLASLKRQSSTPVLQDIQAALEPVQAAGHALPGTGKKVSEKSRIPEGPVIDTKRDPEAKVSRTGEREPSPATGAARHTRSQQPAVTEKAETRATSLPDIGGRKEYFTRTAAILETGKALPAEMESLVLRDVREWVADSHPDADEASPDRGRADPIAAGDFPRSRVSEVRAIRDGVRPERAEEPEAMERNFELSIGTINVIIDQPEKAAPVPQPRQPANPAGPEPAPRSSRLSRSYL